MTRPRWHVSNWRIAWLGDSVVHLSGLFRLARALATGEATLMLQISSSSTVKYTCFKPADLALSG